MESGHGKRSWVASRSIERASESTSSPIAASPSLTHVVPAAGVRCSGIPFCSTPFTLPRNQSAHRGSGGVAHDGAGEVRAGGGVEAGVEEGAEEDAGARELGGEEGAAAGEEGVGGDRAVLEGDGGVVGVEVGGRGAVAKGELLEGPEGGRRLDTGSIRGLGSWRSRLYFKVVASMTWQRYE